MDIRFWLRRAKTPHLPGTVYCTLTNTSSTYSNPTPKGGIRCKPGAV